MSTVALIHRRGTRGTQPLANSVGVGTLYFVTDENVIERSDGSSWQSYSDAAGGGGGTNTIIQHIIREETFIEEAIPIPGRDGIGGGSGSSVVVKEVYTQNSTVTDSAVVIPFDNTKPQNTEGVEILTVSITPSSATNKLRIDVLIFATVTATPWIIAALFKDSGADALAVAAIFPNLNTAGSMLPLTFTIDAGSTSAQTFKIRIGPSSAATVTVNGQSGAGIFGGAAISRISVTEYIP